MVQFLSQHLVGFIDFDSRPWNGVYVDSQFLNSVESAWKGAQVILALYKDMNVQPLIESPTRKDVDLDNGGRFLREVANSGNMELLPKTKAWCDKIKNTNRRIIEK